jgi:hypothetical protein
MAKWEEDKRDKARKHLLCSLLISLIIFLQIFEGRYSARISDLNLINALRFQKPFDKDKISF